MYVCMYLCTWDWQTHNCHLKFAVSFTIFTQFLIVFSSLLLIFYILLYTTTTTNTTISSSNKSGSRVLVNIHILLYIILLLYIIHCYLHFLFYCLTWIYTEYSIVKISSDSAKVFFTLS